MKGFDKTQCKEIRSLGSGGFGRVALVHYEEQPFALKEIDFDYPQGITPEVIQTEALFMEQLCDQNIIRFEGLYQDENQACILMEYADMGSMSYYTKRPQKEDPRKDPWTRLNEDQIMFIFVQLCQALKVLHDKDILHRDFNCNNVFLSKCEIANQFIVKIGDFGLSKQLKLVQSKLTAGGQPNYLPPEYYHNNVLINFNSRYMLNVSDELAKKIDIWGLGCMLYELFAAQYAFADPNLQEKITSLPHQQLQSNVLGEATNSEYFEQVNLLLSEMLHKDPAQRPSISQVLEKDFIKEYMESRIDKLYKDLTDKFILSINPTPENKQTIIDFFQKNKDAYLLSLQDLSFSNKVTKISNDFGIEKCGTVVKTNFAKISNPKSIQNYGENIFYYGSTINERPCGFGVVQHQSQQNDLLIGNWVASLRDYVTKQRVRLSAEQIVDIFIQICQLLKQSTATNTLYALEASSVRLVPIKDGYYEVKMTKIQDQFKFATDFLPYAAPEIEKVDSTGAQPKNPKSDVWSLGCILYELCFNESAFKSSSTQSLRDVIKIGAYKKDWDRITQETIGSFPKLVDLIKSILQVDPTKRPTLDSILELDFVKSFLSNRKNKFISDYVKYILSNLKTFTISDVEKKLISTYIANYAQNLPISKEIQLLQTPFETAILYLDSKLIPLYFLNLFLIFLQIQNLQIQNLSPFVKETEFFGQFNLEQQIQSGEFKVIQSGFGVQTDKKTNNILYIGFWANGHQTGEGIQKLYNDDGSLRETRTGMFLKGIQNGEGTRKMANGDLLEGEFQQLSGVDGYFQGKVNGVEGKVKVLKKEATKMLIQKKE